MNHPLIAYPHIELHDIPQQDNQNPGNQQQNHPDLLISPRKFQIFVLIYLFASSFLIIFLLYSHFSQNAKITALEIKLSEAFSGQISQISEKLNTHQISNAIEIENLNNAVNSALPIGSVIWHGSSTGNFSGITGNSTWVPCDGRSLSKLKYSELYEMIGDSFSGKNDSDTFNIPDLRGRTILGSGDGDGSLSRRGVGEKGGSEQEILTIAQMPSHTHGIQYGRDSSSTSYGSLDHLWTSNSGTTSSYSAGGDQPHNNMMPFLSLHTMIRIL